MTAPLAGLSLLLTRPPHQAAAWSEALRAQGAAVHELATIAIAPPADPAPLAAARAALAGYDWVLFTSPNAVRALGAPVAGPRVGVVGPGTREAAAGWPVALTASRSDGLGLAEALVAMGPLDGARVLVPRGDLASPAMPAALRAAGAQVDEVEAYRTQPAPDLAAQLAALRATAPLDWAVLASGSAYQALRAAWPEVGATLRIATIGPRTSAVVRAAGDRVAAEAAQPTAEALAAAIAAAR